MNNERLMKIVQAVNDSRTEPVDIENNRHKLIARVIDHKDCTSGDIHSVNDSATFKSWQYICTVEEFNQCVKEMSAGYGKKESEMKDNKHPHHDLIVEWLCDTRKEIEVQVMNGWDTTSIESVIGDDNANNTTFLFRFKPREFVKGHWYPCVFKGNNKDSGYPMMFDGGGFVNNKEDDCPSRDINFSYIGESLGELNFK